MHIVKNCNKISTLINLQNITDVITRVRYDCNGNTHQCRCDIHAPVQVIYRSYRYTWQHILHPSLVTLENWPSGKDGRLVTLTPCRLWVRILTWKIFFCNFNLFRVPLSWTGSIQMKSIMTFIRGYRCIYREKDIFKNGREVKRLKE